MKAFRFLLAILFIAILGQASHQRLLFVLDYALLGVLVFSFIWARLSLYWIEVERLPGSERSQVGQYFRETLVLRNRSLLPKLWIEVVDNSDLPGHHLTCVQSLKPFGSVTWRASTYCSMRGSYHLGPVSITAGDPFGIFRYRRNLPVGGVLNVLPAVFDIRKFEGLNGALPGGNPVSKPTHHITPSINGLREYRPGDALNRIHWPSTARQNRLIVKEFEFDPAVDVQIFLDLNINNHWVLDRSGRDGQFKTLPASQTSIRTNDSTEEYAVAVGASLAKHFLKVGRSVGLVGWGQHHEQIPADRGERQLLKLLETLAVVRAQGTTGFGQLIAAELPRLRTSDTLVLVTSSLDEGWISVLPLLLRKSVKVAVVLIEAATFGAKDGMLFAVGGLAAMNVPTYIIKRGDDISQALDSELAQLAQRFS